MRGKYNSWFKYFYVVAYRGLIRALIRPLISWKPQSDSVAGYTIIIGCLSELPELLLANLRCLARLKLTNLSEIIIVADSGRNPVIELQISQQFPWIKCRFIYYNLADRVVTRLVRWPWINSWLSWSKGIAAASTRYALLHDLDAMPIDVNFIEIRYDRIRTSGCEYLGIRNYDGLGIVPTDGLVTTFELAFDVAFIRSTFVPLNLFNHVALWRGKSVEFDTFLFAQSRGGRKEVLPADLESLVHPSQMICQYAYHVNQDRRLPATTNNLMMLPYFLALGSDLTALQELTASMLANNSSQINLFGHAIDVRLLTGAHVAWITKQVKRLEIAIFGLVRPQVNSYLNAFQYCAEKNGAVSVAAI